ncbi:DUF4369 domain-containing protein [Desertivirga brevis]|uniref:DUF4369 domain-containing protein n=1 Tax=Desertivirga brevis TaxID=2810310 RepID=UPI001A97C778|nr:DUF4369 domain-containing protein [Pedobacter sp. SYSU D00873]
MFRNLWKKGLLAIVFTIAGGALYAQKSFTISGELSKERSGLIRLSYFNDSVRVVDSMQLQQGTFVFKGKVKEPVLATLEINPTYNRRVTYEEYMNRDAVEFYLEPSDIRFKSSAGVKTATITGSKNQILLERINNLQAKLDSQLAPYEKLYMKYQSERDTAGAKSLMLKVNPILKKKKETDSVFVVEHPDSYAAFNIFYQKRGPFIIELPLVEQEFKHFSKKLRGSFLGRKMAERIATAKRLEPGNKAPDFNLPDVDGRPVSLSSLQGKNVLLVFWTRSMPNFPAFKSNINKAWEELGKDSLSVLAVSFGADEAMFKQILERESIKWLSVYDVQGMDFQRMRGVGSFAKTWDLSPITIPQAWLINSEGIILARNLKIDQKIADRIRGLLLHPIKNKEHE